MCMKMCTTVTGTNMQTLSSQKLVKCILPHEMLLEVFFYVDEPAKRLLSLCLLQLHQYKMNFPAQGKMQHKQPIH